MRKIFYVIIFFGLFFITSCSNDNPKRPIDDTNDITTFTLELDKTEVSLRKDEEISVLYFLLEDIDLNSIKANITYDESIINLSINKSNLLISGLKEGKATIFFQYSGCEEMYKLNVTVNPAKAMFTDVSFNDIPTKMMVKDQFVIEFISSVSGRISIKSSDNSIVEVKGNTITARKKGHVKLDVTLSNSDDQYVESFEIDVDVPEDNIAPEIKYTGDKDFKISYASKFNPLDGVTAIDNLEGDITSDIIVTNNVNNLEYGTYDVLYEVSDSSGNTTKLKRSVEVVWDYGIKFIGHAGSFFGAQNSEESCIYALKNLNYQALECDLKTTKDGKFVCSHNDAFNGVDGKSYTISNYTLSELEAKTFKEKRGGGESLVGIATKTYEFKVMTLKRYLEICKEYNAIAIIELKGCPGISQTDQSKMQDLMDLIESVNMRDQVVFLASAYNCLIWTREHGYSDIPCQYLMSTCDSEDAYNRAVKYGFDISICVTYGNYTDKFTEAERKAYKENWIKKYQQAGCEVSVWTFTQYCDYRQVQEWIDFGVDWLTCDWQKIEKLDLSRVSKKLEHTVKFIDSDNKVLKIVNVKDGKSAFAPEVNPKEGYVFAGWDKDISNITSDLEVKACYNEIEYKVNYDLNLYVNHDGIKYYITRADVLPIDTNLKYTISSNFTLPLPVTTLKFNGWYKNKECTGDKVISIPTGQSGDVTYYASWSDLEFVSYTSKINYVLDNGENDSSNPTNYTEGIETTLLPAVKNGYTFIGWTLKDDSTDYLFKLSDRLTGEITLYANFKINYYNIKYNLGDGKWDLNPTATGDPIGITNVTAGIQTDYWTKYQTNVFFYNKGNSQEAIFSRRIYAKHITGDYYEFVTALQAGNPNTSLSWDIVIQVSDGNSAEYQNFGKIIDNLKAGDIIKVENKEGEAKKISYYHPEQVNGLVVDNYVVTYTVNELPLLLPVAVKDGKRFIGWSLKEDLSNPFTTLPEGIYEDLILYAVFE